MDAVIRVVLKMFVYSCLSKLKPYWAYNIRHKIKFLCPMAYSKNVEKVTHIKGRLYQAMLLYNYGPFPNGNFLSKERICSQRE